MTDAAATTHSSATIQQPHASQRQHLPHAPAAAAHDTNDAQQTRARQRTRRRTIAAVVPTGLTSACATNNNEVTSGRDAKHRRHEHNTDHDTTPAMQPRTHIRDAVDTSLGCLLMSRCSSSRDTTRRCPHADTVATASHTVHVASHDHATYVQHLALSHTTPETSQAAAVTRSVPAQCTPHTTIHTHKHNSNNGASTARDDEALHTTRQHTAAPHLHATLATMARDATPAPRTTPCTQPCSPILDIANTPAREAGTAWCRRPDTAAATAARATTPRATHCTGGWPTATSCR